MASNANFEQGNKQRRPSEADPEAGPSSTRRVRSIENDRYYEYHSESELEVDELEADRRVFNSATEQERHTAAGLTRHMTQITQQSPKHGLAMLKQILCMLGPYFPGMPKDPRTALTGPLHIEPREVLKAGILENVVSDTKEVKFDVHVGAVKNFWETFTAKSRMSNDDFDKLQTAMCEVRFPHERKGGQFGRNICLWTPSMWGYILDVVGYVIFNQVLSQQDFQLYCKLHWAVVVCNRTRNRELLQYAQKLLELYLADYKTIVGSVPSTVHSLLEILDIGPLQGQSSTQLNRPYPTVTHEGRRVEIREKFLLRSETISATDANSWFLVKTENGKDVKVAKFVKALASEQDFGSLVVLGRPLAKAAMKAFTHPVRVPAALNVFVVEHKQALKKAQRYRISDIVCKLCVVDLPVYTSFVPLIESFAELFELPEFK